MSRLIVAVPRAEGDALARDAVRHGHHVIAREVNPAQDLVRAEPPEAVVIAASLVEPSDLAAFDAAGVPVVILVATAGERVRMGELGRHELLDDTTPWSAIEEMLAGRVVPPTVAWRERSEQSGARGTVIAVWGPGGAPGRTTIAISLAAELSASGRRVLLVDADTYGASVAPALGLLDEAPGFAAACRLAATDSLTGPELDRLAVCTGEDARIHVLSGITRAARWPELGAARIEATLEACRDWADVVVVDVAASVESDEELVSDLDGPRRNAATLTVLAAADRLVAVGAADPIGLSRFLRAYPDALEVVRTTDVHVVINRVRRAVSGVGDLHIVRSLERFGGIRGALLVPDDRDALDAAVLAGRSLRDSAPRSAARLAVRTLAERLDPALGDRRQRRPRSKRLALSRVDPQ